MLQKIGGINSQKKKKKILLFQDLNIGKKDYMNYQYLLKKLLIKLFIK